MDGFGMNMWGMDGWVNAHSEISSHSGLLYHFIDF